MAGVDNRCGGGLRPTGVLKKVQNERQTKTPCSFATPTSWHTRTCGLARPQSMPMRSSERPKPRPVHTHPHHKMQGYKKPAQVASVPENPCNPALVACAALRAPGAPAAHHGRRRAGMCQAARIRERCGRGGAAADLCNARHSSKGRRSGGGGRAGTPHRRGVEWDHHNLAPRQVTPYTTYHQTYHLKREHPQTTTQRHGVGICLQPTDRVNGIPPC